jgi:hypothetical protein
VKNIQKHPDGIKKTFENIVFQAEDNGKNDFRIPET